MRASSRATVFGVAVGALAAAAAMALLTAGGAVANHAAATDAYPRAQTLYTGGTQWGNIVGFNPYVGNYAAGTVGLVNETLVRYDPLSDKYIPWLAKSASFTSPKVFTIKLRTGVKWSDGTPFTAADVKWNIDLGRFATIPWHNLYTGVSSVTAAGDTVTVTFKGTPKYQEWQNALWAFIAMIQPTQWKAHENANEITTWSPDNPIGTGPYVLDKAGFDPTTRVVWKKNPNGWWAAKAGISPEPKPQFIIDLVNSSNNVALSLMLNGQEDLNNNYLPGMSTLLKGGYGLQTYFSKPPYMLSANTAWLLPNVTKKPLSDVQFRRALAYAIDVNRVISVDYGNLVMKASPTGLLPTWSKYIDKSLVKQFGFTYNPAKAKAILTSAGYKLGKDGYFRNPDGSKISLSIVVPSGWSDWMQAIQMIADSAKKVGIKITPAYPEFNTYQQAMRNAGKFDLMIDNNAGGGALTDTPWAYYNYLFHLPILKSQTNFNYERYTNRTAWNLVQKLDTTPKTDVAGMKSTIAQLQKIFMQQLPEIPLWYNGVWSQASTQTWTNWPSAASNRHYLPAMWRGYLQMTGIDMIAHLQPAKIEK